MDPFEVIMVDRVVSDEVLVIQDTEMAVPINDPLPLGSQIDRQGTQVEVVVAKSDLRSDPANDLFFIDLDLLITRKMRITRPESPLLLLEFIFNKTFTGLAVTGSRPSQIPTAILNRLRSHIFNIQADDTIRLNTGARTFDGILAVTLTTKIVFEDQILLPVPTPPTQPTLPTQVPPRVMAALVTAAGKIRSQIGSQHTKQRLLQELARARDLLQAGQVLETLAVLSDIIDEMQAIFNVSSGRRTQVNLVLSDLVGARKQVAGLLL